jgi:pyruvate,water dikinase
MENLIFDFKDPAAAQLSASGGKGANLSKMTREAFPVPEGLIVSTHAFRLFLEALPGQDQFHLLLDQIQSRFQPISTLSQAIRDLIEAAPIPQSLADELHHALARFPAQQYFAVRSSATAEDLPYLSFAGQQDTYLNIQGPDDLLIHIRKCWASLFTERAVTYRLENGIGQSEVQMAVVLQRMVFPQVSGILFSADPISNNHQVLTINAGYGLGEALVSGIVNPDLIAFDKREQRIIRYEIAEKKLKIEAIPGGGTQKLSVADEQARAASLTDEQVYRLAELGKNVEAYYQAPQDIEWAIADGKVYLLQTRPITSLYPIPEPKPQDANLHVYFSFGHAQMNTNPLSPLGISFLQLLLPFGRPSLKMVYSPYLLQAGGRLFADLSALLNNRVGRKALPLFLPVAEPVSAKQISHIVQTPTFQERNAQPAQKIHFSVLTEWLLPLMGRVLRALFLGRVENIPIKLERLNRKSLEECRRELQNTPMPEKIALIEKMSARFFAADVIINAPLIAAGIVSSKMLGKLLQGSEQQALLSKVQRGLEGNITTEMDLVIADLANELGKAPQLADLFHQIVNGELAWDSGLMDDFPKFKSAWQDFMGSFGMRTPGEIDMALPRWQDRPQSLLQMLLSFQSQPGSVGHRQRFAQFKKESQNAQEEILRSLKSTWRGRLKYPLVKRMLRVFTVMSPKREHPKYLIVCLMQMIRDELLVIAGQMTQHGDLEQAEDIWFVRLNELRSHFLEHPLPLKQIILERRQAYKHFERLSPPRVITSDGEIPTQRLSGENFPPGALAGSPVSAGLIEGLAHVILDPRNDRLLPGEILVAPFTDPGWTPLFVNAIGLVLETGGLMTHGSVVAREYGIPAVVGIIDGTKIIKTGMRIRVNGDLGYVEILKPPSQDTL